MAVDSVRRKRIFLSYRRRDTPGSAGRLSDRLSSEFGRDTVFIDVEDIKAGEDFADSIEKAMGEADIALFLIGRWWNEISDPSNDAVLREMELANAHDTYIIPVLVDGAPIPQEIGPSSPFRRLVESNAAKISNERWDETVDPLVNHVKAVLARTPPAPSADDVPPSPSTFGDKASSTSTQAPAMAPRAIVEPPTDNRSPAENITLQRKNIIIGAVVALVLLCLLGYTATQGSNDGPPPTTAVTVDNDGDDEVTTTTTTTTTPETPSAEAEVDE